MNDKKYRIKTTKEVFLKKKVKDKLKIDKKIKRTRRDHAIRRVKQRYGIRLTNANYLYLCQKIIEKEDGIILVRQRKNSSRWLIKYQSIWMFAVYLEEDQIIVTFLPKGRIPKRIIESL